MTHEHNHHEQKHREHAVHEHAVHEHEPLDYEAAVADFRARKDAYFKTGQGSPIPVTAREAFSGLHYYQVDPGLVFEGLALAPYTGDEPVQFQIPTSDDRLRPAERAGLFSFVANGTQAQLTAYRFANSDSTSLFVPFLDRTSGTDTYGAGRYLDLEPNDDGTYDLDFNLAYHPSCLYDVKFSCPLTPPENRLGVPIEAGERLG